MLLTRCVLVNFPQLDPSAVPGDEDSQMTALLVAGLFFQLRATKYLNSKTPAPGVTVGWPGRALAVSSSISLLSLFRVKG